MPSEYNNELVVNEVEGNKEQVAKVQGGGAQEVLGNRGENVGAQEVPEIEVEVAEV
jgi:hypothetical protein